jgi:DNA polymerase-1
VTQPKALIDAEVYLYRAAAAAEYEAEWAENDWTYLCRHDEARASFQDTITGFREALPDHRLVLALSDGRSFRYDIFPGYKANRRKTRKPAGYPTLLRWLFTAASSRDWEVELLPDVEGDDTLGILYEEGDVIVSIDKDLLTIPGLHYRDEEFLAVSRVEADRNFYGQALTGDTTDGYPGCPGVGKVGAAKLLAPYHTEQEMWQAVLGAYAKAGLSERVAIQQARCARILRAGEYEHTIGVPALWNPPNL